MTYFVYIMYIYKTCRHFLSISYRHIDTQRWYIPTFYVLKNFHQYSYGFKISCQVGGHGQKFQDYRM